MHASRMSNRTPISGEKEKVMNRPAESQPEAPSKNPVQSLHVHEEIPHDPAASMEALRRKEEFSEGVRYLLHQKTVQLRLLTAELRDIRHFLQEKVIEEKLLRRELVEQKERYLQLWRSGGETGRLHYWEEDEGSSGMELSDLRQQTRRRQRLSAGITDIRRDMDDKIALHKQLMVQIKEKRALLSREGIQYTFLRMAIRGHKETLKTSDQEMALLRYWADPLYITYLPDDILMQILQYVDFVNQLRIRRVCTHWKFLLSTSEHAYLDMKILLGFKRACKLRKELDGEGSDVNLLSGATSHLDAWKFTSRTVRRLTYDGLFDGVRKFSYEKCLQTTRYLSLLVGRFPELRVLNLVNVTMPWAPHWADLVDSLRAIRVTIAGSFAPVLPIGAVSFLQSGAHATYCNKSRLMGSPIPKPPPVKIHNWYCHISKMVVSSEKEYRDAFDHLVWPYPDMQIEWLAKYAPCLSTDGRLMKWLKDTSQWGSLSRRASLLCSEHDLFCEHLGSSFYKEELDGSFRCLVALCILGHEIPEMQPPPYQFDFDGQF